MTQQDLLATALAAGLEPEGLDEAVHEAKSREASAINNAGLEAQIDCLVAAFGLPATQRLIENAARGMWEADRGDRANDPEA